MTKFESWKNREIDRLQCGLENEKPQSPVVCRSDNDLILEIINQQPVLNRYAISDLYCSICNKGEGREGRRRLCAFTENGVGAFCLARLPPAGKNGKGENAEELAFSFHEKQRTTEFGGK